MNSSIKAQAALEYLLLLGGVVMIAAVVIALLAGLGQTGKDTTDYGAIKINEAFENILAGTGGGGSPAVCGDSIINGTEDCDPTAIPIIPAGTDCTTIAGGYTGGTLGCNDVGNPNECTFDASACTSLTAPGPITGFSASVAFPNLKDAQLSWTNPATSARTYVRRGTTCPTSSTDGQPACNPSGTIIVSGATDSCNDLGVSPTGTYCYAVFANNAGGDSATAPTANATITCGNGTIETPVGAAEVCDGTNTGSQTCATQGYASGTLGCNSNCGSFNISECIPNSVTSFRANVKTLDGDGKANDMELTWGLFTGSGTSIIVRRGDSVTGYPTSTTGIQVCNVATSETGCLDKDLADGTYYYSAFAVNGTQFSARATVSKSINTSGNYPPFTPMLFSPYGIGSPPAAITLGSGNVQFNWDGQCFEDVQAPLDPESYPCSDIDHYKIYYKTGSNPTSLGDYTNVIVTLNNNTTFTQPGLTPGILYHYYIMAVDNAGQEGTTWTPGSADLAFAKFTPT